MRDPNKALEDAIVNMDQAFKTFAQDITKAMNTMFAHSETMAAHIIALEAVVSILASKAGVSAEEVETWINKRISDGTEGKGNAEEARGVALDLLGVKSLYNK